MRSVFAILLVACGGGDATDPLPASDAAPAPDGGGSDATAPGADGGSTPAPDAFVDLGMPGVSLLGTNDYVEYIQGDIPIILSCPHDGALRPSTIPDRTYGRVSNDGNAMMLLREVAAELELRTGRHPHVIMNHLARIKLDPNREIVEAAQGSAEAETAWAEYYAFGDEAKRIVAAAYGRGHYFALHGNFHENASFTFNGDPHSLVEYTYVLEKPELNLDDASIQALWAKTSVKTLVVEGGDLLEIMRGDSSLGGLMQGKGWGGLPSPATPRPGPLRYYETMYEVARHGSGDFIYDTGGIPFTKEPRVSATMIEVPKYSILDDPPRRQQFAVDLVDAILDFLATYHGYTP